MFFVVVNIAPHSILKRNTTNLHKQNELSRNDTTNNLQKKRERK